MFLITTQNLLEKFPVFRYFASWSDGPNHAITSIYLKNKHAKMCTCLGGTENKNSWSSFLCWFVTWGRLWWLCIVSLVCVLGGSDKKLGRSKWVGEGLSLKTWQSADSHSSIFSCVHSSGATAVFMECGCSY